MNEALGLADAIANYGVLVVIAAVFLAGTIIIMRYFLKSDAKRTEREEKRHEQFIELTRLAVESTAKGTAAIENSTKASESMQTMTESVLRMTESTYLVLKEVVADLKDQKHLTDKIFTELRTQSARKE